MKVSESTKKFVKNPYNLTMLIVLLLGVSSAFAQVGAASADLTTIQTNTEDFMKKLVGIVKAVVFGGCAVALCYFVYQGLIAKKPGSIQAALYVACGALLFGNVGSVLKWIFPAGWFTGSSFITYL